MICTHAVQCYYQHFYCCLLSFVPVSCHSVFMLVRLIFFFLLFVQMKKKEEKRQKKCFMVFYFQTLHYMTTSPKEKPTILAQKMAHVRCRRVGGRQLKEK